MVQSVPAPVMTPYYAQLVLEAATFRRVEQCGMRLIQIGRSRRGMPDEAFERAAETWRELADTHERWQSASTPGAAVTEPTPMRAIHDLRRDGPTVARAR
jgi:replicative DNA helicase